jgi:DNA mismatch repair protein MutH
MSPAVAPPRSRDELRERAAALRGRTLDELARLVGRAAPRAGLHQKGKMGELLEAALGATGGAAARMDFPDLGVELKTLPTDERGRPRESTFVCAIRLDDAEHAEWETSWVREKLSCVLFVPLLRARRGGAADVVGDPLLWSPSPDEEAVLRDDFEEIMGLVGVGRIEDVSAHLGRALQVRPKARDGSARTVAFGAEGERIATVPRGFYLRATFTASLLERAR